MDVPEWRAIIIEVKTTDAYSINLNTIANYRRVLITEKTVTEDVSSILLVVGRQETENLEAQIRGSKYAWNVRVISVDALLRLIFIKEEVEDPSLVQRIHAVLVPHEFTRLDIIADLLFSAAKEIKQEEAEPIIIADEQDSERLGGPKFTPVAFHEDCIKKVQAKLGISMIRRTRAGYSSPDKNIGVICAVSKEHNPEASPNYWFAFHPHQEAFLEQFQDAFVALGCGSSDRVLLFPYQKIKGWLENSWQTVSEDRAYRHIVVYRKDESFELRLRKGHNPIDLTPYILR